jgi:hypothetical protein
LNEKRERRTMLISVKEANESKTTRGSPMLQVVTGSGEKMTCFRPEYFDLLKPGMTVAEWVQRRRYSYWRRCGGSS